MNNVHIIQGAEHNRDNNCIFAQNSQYLFSFISSCICTSLLRNKNSSIYAMFLLHEVYFFIIIEEILIKMIDLLGYAS